MTIDHHDFGGGGRHDVDALFAVFDFSGGTKTA